MSTIKAIPMQATASKAQVESDRNWAGLYRTSAIMLILTAVLWTIVTYTARSLYATGWPADPAAYLQLVSQHQALANLTWILWIVADLLLMAPTIAMYLVLKRYNPTLALLGAMFAMFFNIYDVCTSELNSLTLVRLSQAYGGAATESARASIVGAATYGFHALPLQTVLSFSVGTFGYLLWCIPMFRSFFRRFTAIFGTFWCLVGLAGSLAPLFPASVILYIFQFLCVPAVGLWFVMVAMQLFRYARQL
jgi:hypothetical protein